MLDGMHSTQIAVRLPDELLTRLYDQIPERFASRAEAVREGLSSLLAQPSLAERVERHRAAWLAQPISPHGAAQMRNDAIGLIEEEPW
jgi:Arc/MetJ-type ribon-helix-helix transcriptional regulator